MFQPAHPPADLPACPRLVAPAPALMGTALLLSHLLTRALAERPFAASDAPAWFEAVARLVRSKLQVCRLWGEMRGVPVAHFGCCWLLVHMSAACRMIAPAVLHLCAGGGGSSSKGLAAGSCCPAICGAGQRQPSC